MDDQSRYSFHNWTDEPFEGRFGGQPYLFASQETREFDPDKLHMLHILAKQLTERELAKGSKGILRSKEAGNDYGKAIDEHGNLYKPTLEMRMEMMRKAIGVLADTPIPYPETQEEEAGATKQTTENIAALQDQVKNLTEMVQGLVNQIGALKSPPSSAPPSSAPPSPPPAASSVGNGQPPTEVAPEATEGSNTGLTRDVLMEMAQDKGIEVPEGSTKDQIIALLGSTGAVSAPPA